MRIRKDSLIYIPLILFPVGTLIANVPVLGNTVNKVLMFFLIFGLLFCINSSRKITFLYVAGTFALTIFDYLVTEGPLYNTNELFYLLIWVLFLNVFIDHWDIWFSNFFRYRRAIMCQIILWNALTFVSMFIKSSYDSTGAFLSWTGGMHRLDSSALLIVSFILYLYVKERNKKLLVYTIIPFAAVLLSGARTYVVIFLVLLIMIFYQLVENKWKFWLAIIPFSFLCVFFVLNTSIIQSRMTLNSFIVQRDGVLSALTSGRSVFWKIDVTEFGKTPLINKIIGSGFNFIRATNEKYYGHAIWAHNDYINIVGCNGFLGLFFYVATYFRTISVYKTIRHNKKSDFLKLLFINCILIFNAMFNMLYTYQCAVYSIPFLMYFLWSSQHLEESGTM